MLAWTGIAASDIAEAAVTDYSLLSDIDFEDPLFATFAEARFADFTGIHFWKHRRLVLPPSFTGQVLTRFDNHDPFLVRHPFGEGRTWLMTSGWQPGDSQLARSSKFAPLMFRLLEQSMPFAAAGRQGHVGDEILWPFSPQAGSVIVQSPAGVRAELAGASTPFSNTDRPGMYTADCGQEAASWAVNLAPDESKTDPLPRETLERFGILTDRPQLATAAEASPTRERQLQWEELERRQQLWKWCLLAGGLLLLLETVWAAIQAPRRRLPEGPPT